MPKNPFHTSLSTAKARYHEVVSEDFLASLEEVRRTAKGEIIYNCPWCEERYGPRPDKKYHKLYFNPEMGVGFCFRCGTSISVEKSGLSLADTNIVLPSLSLKGRDSNPPHKDSFISDLFLSLPITKGKEMAHYYLMQRSPYLYEVFGKYKVPYYQAYYGDGLYGVVFPFYVEGKIVSYQVRYFRLDGRAVPYRYDTRQGPKYPYSPHGLGNITPVDSISLVEGVFGTFGLLYLAEHLEIFSKEIASAGLSVETLRKALSYPIATLGYSLSEGVLWAIKSLAPVHVVVVMDDKSLSYQAVLKLLENLTSVERIDILNIGDPDEYATALYKRISGLTESVG